MSVTFNHTIIVSADRDASADFYRELFDLAEGPSWGPFRNLLLDDAVETQASGPTRSRTGAMLQFASPPVDFIQPQHYALLVDDATFDRAMNLLRGKGIEHWADPQMSRPGEINTEHGGRGVYLRDPSGHFLEFTTAPYL
ncbi:VOC family protein [Gordonia sp. TBRC 11910]|uniref:VOC family protein n=1 Tax=Gordonia asplenii TaxID=2725283 RepID=A0A848L841_9ACTN|nr:VOC family protein [Gordonia asplenii]NMO04923.1 VOC family protein [Gordonia asplenii]